MFKKSKRKASKIKRNGYILGVIGTTLKLEANYKCKDQKVYTVYQILDRWLTDKPDPVTNEHVHIGYTVLYENFLNEPWVLKLQDMTNCKDLIAEFERLNPIVQVEPTVFKPRVAVYSTHSKDYSKSNGDNRTGAKIGDRGEAKKSDPIGEFTEYTEGYGEDACSIIALNIHFRKRLFESLEDFRASFTSYYKKKY